MTPRKISYLLYRLYIWGLSAPLTGMLFLANWKRSVILQNLELLFQRKPTFFRLRFYWAISGDLVQLIHSRYLAPIRASARSRRALLLLKAGPSLLLTAHFHHWELMGKFLVDEKVALLSAARPMKVGWAHGLLLKARLRLGSRTATEEVWTQGLEHLRKGGCFAFLWDQFSPAHRLSEPLLGRMAAMNPLPPLLQNRTGAAVFFAVLLPFGEFRIFQIAKAGASISGGHLACRYHRFLGRLILRYPAFWYGFAHRRFKDTHPYDPDYVSRETTPAKALVSRETSH